MISLSLFPSRPTAMAATSLRRVLGARKPVLLVCDVQSKFAPVIHRWDAVVWTARAMAASASHLEYPVAVTEQYPQKLGQTVPEVADALPAGTPVVAKRQFSMHDAVARHVDRERHAVVLVGIEAHVCVQQTCLDFLDRDVPVVVLADGVSSQREVDRETALRHMERAGACVTTAESLLFAMLGSADHPSFKAVSKEMTRPRPEGWLR